MCLYNDCGGLRLPGQDVHVLNGFKIDSLQVLSAHNNARYKDFTNPAVYLTVPCCSRHLSRQLFRPSSAEAGEGSGAEGGFCG